MALDISATVVARLDNPDSTDDDALIEADEEEAVLATPVTLAIDVEEAEAPPADPTP
jgi:exoribonuclease-2